MKNFIVILISFLLTILNINCYGELSPKKLKKAKLNAKLYNQIVINNAVDNNLNIISY